MMKPFKPFLLFCLPLILIAWQGLTAAQAAPSSTVSRGRVFAQSTCGGCHAVGRYGRSPHSSSPPFPAIVNQEGLTAKTLTTWLRGAHNYPREMDFYLTKRQVDELVAYMLTLKDPNYRRPPD